MKEAIKKIYSKTDARYNLPSIINRVRDGEGPVYITDRGNISAILISYNDYEKNTPKSTVKIRKKFGDSSLFGLWKDRTDIINSVDFVNKMRKEEEERTYK